jgi:superoxide dismutase, Cu-Zn family
MKHSTAFGIAAAALLSTCLVPAAAAQSAKTASATLADKNGKHVGAAELSQTAAGVLLKLSIAGLPPGERAFHIHAVGKCEPPFESAGPHVNPGNQKHGLLAGAGHAGDMPNLHIPSSGNLSIELVNAAVTLERGKPNSLLDADGSSIVIHEGKDDYKSDPAGDSGGRIACGVITEAAPTVGRPARSPVGEQN